MVTTALMAFLHHLLAFTLTACLVYEFIAYHKNMGIAEIRRIQRVDLIYGISAGLLLLIGLLRVFFFEKGINFYLNNPFFWVKMTAFLLVGLLSINPTIRYIRWNRTLRQNEVPEISETEYKRTRILLSLEVIGIAVILLAAPMMARGIGMN
jgi:putative membrane protein